MAYEIRIDPLTGLRTVIGDGTDAAAVTSSPPAAEGTPPFSPILSDDAPEPPGEARAELFARAAARGAHERLQGGSPEQWRERMRAHPDAACVQLIAQDGVADLYALDFVPALLARERERFGAYAVRTMGGNLLGDLLQEEVRRRERLVAYDDEAVLLVPFAARRPYELMLVPRRPRARFEEDGPLGEALLRDGVERLGRVAGGPVLAWIRTAPRGAEQFCWRIDLVPALAGAGPLEQAAGLAVNPLAPEAAAAHLREA
ncbi:MAG TPA: hypothetical protein VHX88_19860 [Solirubrobacteraceae bacterium]|jgi:UDPglucose--hexose-1-phosphate uridylyltransferase|nr:hypothetical protein [Solirubrobacteraceae bacterium]